MPIPLIEIRDLLLPGLYAITRKAINDDLYGDFEVTMAAPHIWVPKLTLPQAAVLGAAAKIIENPIVTRRFWSGWRLFS